MTQMDFIPLILILITICLGKVSIRNNGDLSLSIDETTIIRGIMATCIVIYHLSLFYNGMLMGLYKTISSIAVGVFFFISGYGLMSRYSNDPNYQKGFLYKRVGKLFLSYSIATLLYWFYYRICGDNITLLEIMHRIIQRDPIVSYSWYIIEIVLLYIVFYLFMLISNKNSQKMLFLNTLLYIIFLYICLNNDIQTHIYQSTHMYVFGMFWQNYEKKIWMLIEKNRFLFLLFFMSLSILLSIIQKHIFIIEMSCMIMIILLFSFINYDNTSLYYTGKISMEIYLLHGLMIKLIRRFVISDGSFVNIIIILMCTWISSSIFNFALNKIYKAINR